MTANDYLRSILAYKKAQDISFQDARLSHIITVLKEWGGDAISALKKSGSSAKGTALHGVADFDIFISLKSSTAESLKEIYNSLDNYVKLAGYVTRRQNVSIGITSNNLQIDLVPGKVQAGYQNYHSIYSSKKDSWMQTNIDLHINTVVNSKRQEEIMLIKAWREINRLTFPSVYLEHVVIEASKNRTISDIGPNTWSVFSFLRESFVDAVFIDPANTNNSISDMLSKQEKQSIASAASIALQKKYWEEIIW